MKRDRMRGSSSWSSRSGRSGPRCWRHSSCWRRSRRANWRFCGRRTCCSCRRWRCCGSRRARGRRSRDWLGRWFGFGRSDLGLLLRFGRSLRVSFSAKMLAYLLRLVVLKRTRMGFLFGNPDLRQVLDQDLGLDLEFPRELVDANLTGVRHSLDAALRLSF
jgi:hypothetical protein